MKVEVTNAKSWPPGTKVGDIVDVPGDSIPAWAAGKCRPVAEAAPAEQLEAPRQASPTKKGR